jgi:heterotetrameric sarcosine oxidase gamma subunit
MDKQATAASIEVGGLSVGMELDYRVASLRYFNSADAFAAGVHEVIGQTLAPPLRAHAAEAASSGARFILFWRSPTENLFLTRDTALFAELQRRLAAEVDGCMVDQTGGIRVLRVTGPKARDLLLRLGAATAIPAEVGGACTGRVAELPVLTASIQAGEYLLLVERVYLDHLLEWMGATAADLAGT